MHRKVKCAFCVCAICICVGGPFIGDAAKAKDFAKGVSIAMVGTGSASASTSDYLYVTNTMGGPEIKVMLAEGIKSFKSRS